MASSSSSPSVPVLASQSWSYDVFLSFRGEDTRKTFVDHLYKALVGKGILTYKDDQTLPQGEPIGPTLETAIEASQISLIIFSANYANSTWCLNELKHIMKCRDERNQTVLPIFYDVEPTEVRKQKGKYKEAFDKHEQENKEKVESWRKTLVEASNISGWETKLIADGYEAEGIQQIVGEILKRLKLETSGANEDLVGMTNRVQVLKSELKIEEGGVRMVGIWGVGGGGKTTLASSVYDEISSMYYGCCFVNNIREESSKNGLEKLQEKILSGILKLQQVQDGRMIMARLRHQKVLIVLDDVDGLDQLEALVGSHDWFGEGSRILITTRDEHLLNAHKVDAIHHISLLNNDEAIKLFRKHAHRDYTPVEDFEQLSAEVVSYASGLPLAVRVLGCFLCDKNISQWRSALARLKEIPDEDIIGKLRISFDGLKSVEKELFLDIACFFRWEGKDEAMKLFEACGFHPDIGVEVLRQKALIVIDEDGEFDMHDLVQEMGHYIVRGEHPKNPEQHSRVWKREDVLRILDMDGATKLDNIEAIDHQDVSYEESQRFLQAAGNMNKLRLLYLHCDWWKSKQRDEIIAPLPENFPPKEICCLLIRNSIQQKQLWEGYKYLPNLRHMELKYLPNLIKIPDFGGLANLERFELHNCPCLEEIHPSMGRLESLVSLSIQNCPRLRKFPSVTRIKKLVTLSFASCDKLEIMSEIQQQQEMDNLGHLDLDNTSGKQVAASCKKPARTSFFVNCWKCGCSSPPPPAVESCSPHNNLNHRRLQFSHGALRKLDLSSCDLGDEEIGSDFLVLPNLEQLNLSSNPLISRLDFSILRLPRLKWLDVSYCRGLVELSELPSSIAVFIADHCSSLESFGDISKCKWLCKVSLYGKNKLGQHRVDTLIHSMLQGNAIEHHHHISVALQHQLPYGFVGRLFRGNRFKLKLPDDWYNDFCGFLMCIVTNMFEPKFKINMMKQEDPPFDLSEVYSDDEAVEPIHGEYMMTFLGYVSFSLLGHTTLSTSSYEIISLTIKDLYDGDETYVGIELIPRKNKSDEVQTTTDCLEFWDEKYQNKELNAFMIQQCNSESSIEILWNPYIRW